MKVACVVYYAFSGVLRYLNKACVFLFVQNILIKKNKTVLTTSISIPLNVCYSQLIDLLHNKIEESILIAIFIKMLVCIVQALLLVTGKRLNLAKVWSYTAQNMPEYADFL